MATIHLCHTTKMLRTKKTSSVVKISHIRQSNELTEAAYYLPLQGKRTLWLCLAAISSRATENQGVVRISVRQYAETFGVNLESASKDVRVGLKQLISPVCFYDTQDGWDEVLLPWVTKAATKLERGVWQFTLHPEIVPYLVGLKNQYTSFNILNCGAFKSTRHIRLYESLSQYKSSGIWRVPPDWLVHRFKLPESQAKNSGELRRRFLEPALKVINSTTPLQVTYEPVIKNGGVVRYDFTIRQTLALSKSPEPTTITYDEAVLLYNDILNGWVPSIEKLEAFKEHTNALFENGFDLLTDFHDKFELAREQALRESQS